MNYVEKSYLSEIELGKKYADLQTLDNIFHNLEINYNFSKEIYNNIKTKFFLYYKAIVYQNNDYADHLFSELINDSVSIYNDGFIHIQLLKLIAYVVYGEENVDIKETLQFLEELEMIMDDVLLSIYYDYLGVYLSSTDINESILMFNKSLEICSNQAYKSIVYFHLVRVESNQYKFLNAFENLQKAKDLFNSELNVRRSVQCETMIAVIYIRSNYYIEADKRLNRLLKDIPDYAENERKTVINNMIWNHIKNGQVSNANTLIHEHYKDNLTPKCIFYLCWGYYKQLNIEQFSYYYNELKKTKINKLFYTIAECCHRFLYNQNETELLNGFVDILKICEKEEIPNIQELLMNDVIELAKNQNEINMLIYALTIKSTLYSKE